MNGEPRREAVFEKLFSGDPHALARAITAVENETPASAAILAAVQPRLGHALLVGFTGPPGAGKSTLIARYISALRACSKTVGVIAVDPSSPYSGGAILGDRIRMSEHADDDGVFIRSIASRGHLGGLSRSASRIADLMDAAGRDVVILETVGAGQSEVEVTEVADVRVVVCAPGLGDDVQAIKAGILEIADVLVVNKADLPLAERAARQLNGMLALRQERREVPVLSTVALDGRGIDELALAISQQAAPVAAEDRQARSLRRARRLLANTAAEQLRTRLLDDANPTLDKLAGAVQRGELGYKEAADQLISACDRN